MSAFISKRTGFKKYCRRCSFYVLTAGYRSRVTGVAGGVSLRAAGEQRTRGLDITNLNEIGNFGHFFNTVRKGCAVVPQVRIQPALVGEDSVVLTGPGPALTAGLVR